MKYKTIQRKALSKLLENIERYPYTVVTAPMGYGKSTAVRDYLDGKNKKYLWISIGTKQVSAAYIWDRITRQVQSEHKEFGSMLNKMGFPEDEQDLISCIQAIRQALNESRFILVIDDYQLIESREIDNFLLNLIVENIPNFHIVVISRGEPDTNIHELVLKGYCNKIEQEIFEVSKEEISEYLEVNDCKVSEDKIQEIYSYTEGWIAAVYLVMMEIRRTGDFGKDYTLDRLVESAVFSQYDQELQELLLKLSILDSYTMEQAMYITESKKVALLLWELCNYNSFLKYDAETGMYKPHNILNNFLNHKMKRSPQIDEKELLGRAGDWYINNGDVLLGFSYLISTNNYNRILEELSKPGAIDLVAKYPDVISDIFNRIPEEDKLQRPYAYITYLYWLILTKSEEKVISKLDSIEKYCNDNYDVRSEKYKNIIGEIYLAKAMLSRDKEEFSTFVNTIKRNLNGDSKIIYRQNFLSFVQPLVSMTFHRETGRYKSYSDVINEEFKCYLRMVSGNNGSLEYLIKAEYYLETMELKLALICAKEAIYEGELNNQTGIVIAANLVLLRIHQYNNNKVEQGEVFKKLDELGEKEENLQKKFMVEMCKIYGYSRMKSIEEMPNGIANLKLVKHIDCAKLNSIKYITQCDLLVIQKKYIELSVMANNFKTYSLNDSLQLGLIYAYVYEAIAKKELYGIEEAKKPLLEALKIGQEDNIIMTFSEYSSDILEILYSVKRERCVSNEYMDQVIYHSERYAENFSNKKGALFRENAKVALLTNREKEVLELMGQGKSNKEIGKELFISEYTVKTILSNIYRKTEVKGRVEAMKLLV